MLRFTKSLLLLILFMTHSLCIPALAQFPDDIANHRECTECGMDRKAFGYSRMLVRFESGEEIGVCSLHCAAIVINNHKEDKVKALLVADRNSHELIPAEQAVWVLGGKKRGVMTMQAKWAFATQESAEAFVKEYGGEIVNWEQALAAARKDFKQMK